MTAVELLDAIETRSGGSSALSTSVYVDDTMFGVVMSSRYVAVRSPAGRRSRFAIG